MRPATTAPAKDQLGPLLSSVRFFVIPQYRLMYVSLAKNACTTLKWMMANLGGEDPSRFKLGLTPFTNEFDVIHDRSQWRRVKRLGDLDPEVRDAIGPDNGWLVFSVVRDPRPRCFSAWQNKLLFNGPNYTRWRGEPWYPRFPRDAATIRTDFAKFVDMLAHHPDHPLRTDTHFRSQTQLLRQDCVTYSQIYDISELSRLRDDVTSHLASFGWSGELYLPRLNETPLRAVASAFAPKVRAQLEEIYAADFEQFGVGWDFADIRDEPWPSSAIAEAQRMAGAGRRMAELRDIGLRHKRQVSKLEQRVAELESAAPVTLPRLEYRLRELARRLAAALDRVAPGLVERIRAARRR